MGPFLISFFFTAGAVTWIFNKLQRYSGNNTQQSAIASAVAGLIIFLVLYFIANSVSK